MPGPVGGVVVLKPPPARDLAGPSIARALREARARTPGLTQATVARRIGICTNAYLQYEHGTREVLVTRLPALAAALGVSIGDLATWATS